MTDLLGPETLWVEPAELVEVQAEELHSKI